MPLAEGSLLDLMVLDKHLGGYLNTALFDILAGLEEIHRRGYCHRDLKPGNVLRFIDDGGVNYFALSDFGLMAVGEDASSTLTPTGAAGGTPAYQAPECAINFKRATTRSDIYSFGALLHDIFSPIARKLPHEELTAPGDIGIVIERCTKRNAHRRYSDVQQLREALFSALSTFVYKFESGEEEQIVRLLSDENAVLSAEEWDRVFDFLDANVEDGQPSRNIFRALRREHIAQLAMDDPDLMIALGKVFANHCRMNAFIFDYCDVLASKAQLFYDNGDVGLKANTATAMLVLATSHNRFFVMRTFMRMAGNIATEVAERMIVEFGVLKIDFKRNFAQIKFAIGADEGQLHPTLQQVLA